MIVAIIDLGKTRAKVALVDTVTASETALVTLDSPVHDGGLYPHLNVETLWDFIIESLAGFAVQYAIDAIGITTHGATVALIDADGELALPVLDYEHDGPEACAVEYSPLRPTFMESGSPRLPGGLNVGAQLFWQSIEFPSAFARVEHILTWPQYWAWRLCGELASDLTSLGCHTDLIDPSTQTFTTLARERGWDRLIPPFKRSGAYLGKLASSISMQTGVADNLPIHVGIHDSNASLVPHLLSRSNPFAVVSTGTWVVAMAVGGDPVSLDETRDTLINIDAFGRRLPSSRFMGGREYELLSRRLAVSDRSGHGHADAIPERSAGSQGGSDSAAMKRVLAMDAMLFPSSVPGCGPYPDQELMWSVTEASLDDLEHAIVIDHYLALMTLTCLELIGARGPILIEGPFARNKCYLDMLAAASARPVMIGDGVTGTSIGTAMLIEPPEGMPSMTPVTVNDVNRHALTQHAMRWMRQVVLRQSR